MGVSFELHISGCQSRLQTGSIICQGAKIPRVLELILHLEKNIPNISKLR